MLYDTSIEYEAGKVRSRLERLIAKKSIVDLTDKRIRTLTQNAYAHHLMQAMAVELNHTLQYVKEVYFKQWCSPDIFWREEADKVSGRKFSYLRSTSDLNVEEMNKAISNFKMFAVENNIYLPEIGDNDSLMRIEIEYERYGRNV